VENAVISRGLALVTSISACALFISGARPQSTSNNSSPPQQNSSAQPHQDRSFYRGTPVAHPEDLSGVWEAPDGHGRAIGIHLQFDTTVPVEATTLTGTRQSWLGLSVGLYRRSGAQLQLGDENFFSDSPRGGSVRYEDGHLTLHFPGIDLDLHRIEGDKWTGRLHREDFDSVVTLARPTMQPTSKATWFLGTWKSTIGSQITCLHIAEASPAALLAWSDTLSTEGSTYSPPQIPKPPYAWERYGELAKVQSAEGGGLSVELSAYSPICCSHPFHATSADKGKAMKAEWPAGPNQSSHKSRWTKMPGNSCVTPAP
jgi:hypothetical protein